MKDTFKHLMPLLLLPPYSVYAADFSVSGLLQLVIYIVVVALVFWVIWWFIGYVGLPEPFNKVVRVIIGLVALIIVVTLLLGLVGGPGSVHLGK